MTERDVMACVDDMRPEWWFRRIVVPDGYDPGAALDFGPQEWDLRFPSLSPQRERELLAPPATPGKSSRQPKNGLKQTPKTYLIGMEESAAVKIGFTSQAPDQRLRSMQTGLPYTLSLLWFTDGDYESDLHDRFAAYRVRGEWFDLTPLGDAIQVVSEAVEQIKNAPLAQE